MTLLQLVMDLDCEVDKVVEALEKGVALDGNFKGHEDEVARQAKRRDDVPVFDASIWAQFGE